MKAEEHEAMTDLRSRTAQQVFDDHLRLSQQRAFDEDIRRNFSPDCVVLTGRGVFRGHDGLQRLARMLGDEVPTGQWEYRVRLVEGNAAYLEWSAHSENAVVDDGGFLLHRRRPRRCPDDPLHREEPRGTNHRGT